MGWGKFIDRVQNTINEAAKDVGQEVSRYAQSETSAYLTPYLSIYTADGRDHLVDTYAPAASTVAGAYGGPVASSAVNTAAGAYVAQRQPDGSSSGNLPNSNENVFSPQAQFTPAAQSGQGASVSNQLVSADNDFVAHLRKNWRIYAAAFGGAVVLLVVARKMR